MEKTPFVTQTIDKLNARLLVRLGLFTALVTLATMVIHIPTPGTQGYVNVGDTIIFTGAALFGWKFGLFIGGVGSFLADVLLGYTHWAPWTLVIKGIEGLIAGWLTAKFIQQGRNSKLTLLLALAASGSWMVIGYFLASWVIYQNVAVAAASIPGNVVQAFASIALSIPLISFLRRHMQHEK